MTLDFIAASLNLPSQVRGKKANLYAHPKRTRAALRLWNANRVEVVSLQELATMSRTSQIWSTTGIIDIAASNAICPVERLSLKSP